MTAHDWYIENLIAYATRTLNRKDHALFASHLERCEECRHALADLERDLAWLPMGVTPAAPRPGLPRELVDGVLRKRRAGWWRRAGALAASSALLLASGAWLNARSQVTRLSSALSTSRGELSATKDSFAAIVGAERVLQKSVTHRGAEGGFLVFYDHDSGRWNVVVHDLPPAGEGEAYQLWFVTHTGLLPGPELRADGARPTFLALPAPDPTREVVGAVLSVGSRDHAGLSPDVELARVTF